jgi:hypothetical protein
VKYEASRPICSPCVAPPQDATRRVFLPIWSGVVWTGAYMGGSKGLLGVTFVPHSATDVAGDGLSRTAFDGRTLKGSRISARRRGPAGCQSVAGTTEKLGCPPLRRTSFVGYSSGWSSGWRAAARAASRTGRAGRARSGWTQDGEKAQS